MTPHVKPNGNSVLVLHRLYSWFVHIKHLKLQKLLSFFNKNHNEFPQPRQTASAQ